MHRVAMIHRDSCHLEVETTCKDFFFKSNEAIHQALQTH
jgi:hypothetical protein